MRIYSYLLCFHTIIVFSLFSLMTSLAAASCDNNSHPAENTKASSLTTNTFHKICPSKSDLGQPICGDGTPFSFYYTSPVRRLSTAKILIQFMGGGACWDSQTCAYQSDMLTFPYEFDQFLGKSCTEIQTVLDASQNDQQYLPVAMLCSQSIGKLDFREYHTVVVPYCTQDVHSGSHTITYENGITVHHTGAHNMLAVLDFVYQNFPHPEHIVLTGCSAGGTALPMAYDLLYHHYNHWRTGGMPLASVMDSPVYLTPSYFLQNGLPNWNSGPLMKKLQFDYKTYSHREDYSTKLMEHVLKRGSKKDPWGIITHSDDPVSLAYYQHMASAFGNGVDDNNNTQRHLEDGNVVTEEQWWSQLSSSFKQVLETHANVDTYVINGEGHCSFGLYYAETEGGDDFTRWASNLLQFRAIKPASGLKWFLFSAMVGAGMLACTVLHQKRQMANQGNIKDRGAIQALNDKPDRGAFGSQCLRSMANIVGSFARDAPITAAYGLTVTLYFICVLSWDHLETWIYNPSIGPTAATLSVFGINNPTLIVYQRDVMRLIESTFLCSGVVTYLLVMLSLYRYVRPVEHVLRETSRNTRGGATSCHFASGSFLEIGAILSFGSNLLYACLGSGASCSSLALILGILTFSCAIHSYHKQTDFPRPLRATIIIFIGSALFLPFNSWIMMTSAMAIGMFLALGIYSPLSSSSKGVGNAMMQDHQMYKSYSDGDDDSPPPRPPQRSLSSDFPTRTIMTRRKRPLQTLVAVVVLLVFLLLFQIRQPNRIYEQPFLTGCDLVYTTHVSEIANSYAGQYLGNSNTNVTNGNYNNGARRRRLDDQTNNADDEDYMCAQFCVPHLVSRPLLWSANVYTGFDVQRGWCEEAGYGQHVADKTFSYKSYSVDVELYCDNNLQ